MLLKKNQYFAFMDYETTGVDTTIYSKTLPIQIGLILTDHKFTKLVEYDTIIKWDSLLKLDDWKTEEQKETYKIHKISLDRIKEEGKYPKHVAMDIIKLIKEYCKDYTRKPCIISDAPNFEMFFTKFIFPDKDTFPFHYNAWGIYPTLQLFGIDISNKPHDALKDARMMQEAMQNVYTEMQQILNFFDLQSNE